MHLFFDTETAGLPRKYKAPVSDLNNWPRLVQLAYLLYDADGNLLSKGDHIIKPEGFTISKSAYKIHGITTQRAMEEGVLLDSVLTDFEELVKEVDTLVAHNMAFDEKIVGAELLRSGRTNVVSKKVKICTMQGTVDFCRIEGYYGYKWPKLSELHYKLFGSGFDEAHNAAADIEAVARCFWELKRSEKI